MCDQQPSLSAFDGFLPILCQSAAATEPGERAFDNPPAWQYLEAFGGVRPFDDLQRPASEADKGTPQLWSGIATIREHVAQLWGLAAELGEDPGRAIPILDIGGVDLAGDQIAAGVSDDVTLAPLNPLPAS